MKTGATMLGKRVMGDKAPACARHKFICTGAVLPALRATLTGVDTPMATSDGCTYALSNLAMNRACCIETCTIGDLNATCDSGRVRFAAGTDLTRVAMRRPASVGMTAKATIFRNAIDSLNGPTTARVKFICNLLDAPAIGSGGIMSNGAMMNTFGRGISGLPLSGAICIHTCTVDRGKVTCDGRDVSFSAGTVPSRISALSPISISFSGKATALIKRVIGAKAPTCARQNFICSAVRSPAIGSGGVITGKGKAAKQFDLCIAKLPAKGPICVQTCTANRHIKAICKRRIMVRPR